MLIPGRLLGLARPVVDRFPRFAAVYRCMRDQLDSMEHMMEAPWGFKLTGHPAMAQGVFEPLETKMVREVLKDMDVLVNVGANIGYYCCHALNMGKSVIAFEPIQRNLNHLYRNIRANGWTNIEVYPMALCGSVGVIEIYGSNTGASIVKGWAGIPEHYVTLVPSSTLDVVLGSRLRGKRVLVIIDVEGAELSVLMGAHEMLANSPKPIWIVEISTREHQPYGTAINPHLKETFELFSKNGYEPFLLEKNLRPLGVDEINLASSGSITFPTHNFVFLERGLSINF